MGEKRMMIGRRSFFLLLVLWTGMIGLPWISAAQSSFVEIGPGGGGAELSAAIHPQNADLLFLGQDVGGILKSTDGGRTWRHVNSGLALPTATTNSLYIQDLAFSPANPAIMFAGTYGGLFRSTDTGESWTRVIPPGTGYEGWPKLFSTTAVDPDGQIVLAGTGDALFDSVRGIGIFRSTDGGNTFAKLTASGIPNNAAIGRMMVDPVSPPTARHFYAATGVGLYRSTNGGLSFTRIHGAFVHNNVRDLALSGNGSNRRLWLALQTLPGGNGGIYHSGNGTDWVRATGNLVLQSGGSPRRVYRLLAHPWSPSIAYVVMREDEEFTGGLFRTVDSGQTWLLRTHDNIRLGWNSFWGPLPETAAISESFPSRLLLGNEAQPLLSNDGGNTWKQVGTRSMGNGTWKGTGAEVTYVYNLAASPTHSGRIYAGYEDIGLWRSDDAGGRWKQLFWYVEGGAGDSDGCSEIHVNPGNGDELYAVAASWSGGLREGDSVASSLLYSSNGGNTWKNLTAGVSTSGRGTAGIDFSRPEASRTILFAQHGGTVSRSVNGGRTWTVSRSGIGDADRVFVLAFDPDRPTRVFAGTHSDFGNMGRSGGLYRSLDGGISWEKVLTGDINNIVFIGAPRRLFVSTSLLNTTDYFVRGKLLVSDDGGNSFRSVIEQPFVAALTAVPGQESTLIAGASSHYVSARNLNAGLYRSIDNGNTWTRLPLVLPHTGILSLLIPPWEPQRILIGTRGAGITTGLLPP